MKLSKRIIAALLSLTTAASVSFAAVPQFYAAGGITAAATETAQKPVRFSSSSIILGKGERFTLKPIFSNSKDSVLRWSTSDSDVAAVKNGVITAVSPGRAVIRVRTKTGGAAACIVRVKEAPSSVNLNTSYVCIGKGETYKFNASLPAGAAASGITYSVKDPLVASCSKKTGVIKGLSSGTTTLTVKTYNGKTAACKIKVMDEPSSVKLNVSKITLGKGETLILCPILPGNTASNTKIFKSSNKKVVSVSSEGKLTAVSAGTAKVSVNLYNGMQASCSVTVKKAPGSFSLSSKNLRLDAGKKYTIYCLLPSDCASNKKIFKSTNTKVATVDQRGNIVAKAPGKAAIKVTLFNGVSASCNVVVPEPEPEPAAVPEISAENYLDLHDDLAVLNVGETFTISSYYQEDKSITCSSADKKVATVTAKGVVKAVGVGTTDITVTSATGKASKVAVIVTGDRYSTTFPAASETDELLNKEKLGKPMKTNCPELDKLVDSIMAKIIKPGMTNAQKVRACYEYLAQNSTYGAPVGYPDGVPYYKYRSDMFIVCDGYSILKNHSGTCENFACALTILMRRLGYKADVVEGLTGLRAGGKGGHFWTDVTLGDKHYSFDAQIENNNLYNGQVLYYWYGTQPEHNFKTCEYQYLHRVHDFAVMNW